MSQEKGIVCIRWKKNEKKKERKREKNLCANSLVYSRDNYT